MGRMNWSYAGFLNIFTLAATIAMNLGLAKKIIASRRAYILIYILFAVLIVVIIIISVNTGLRIKTEIKEGVSFAEQIVFASYCST